MPADAPSPAFRTVAESVKPAPAAGLPSLTDGDSTTRSGWVCGGGGGGSTADTVTRTDAEQLFAVSDSPATESTHAP